MSERKTRAPIDPEAVLEKVRRHFDDLRQTRATIHSRLRRNLIVVATAALILAITVVLILPEGLRDLSFLVVFFALIALGYIVYRTQKQWRAAAESALVPAALEAIDPAIEYRREGPKHDLLAPFRKLQLINDRGQGDVTQYLRGRYRQRRFECAHALVRSVGNKDDKVPVFCGLLIRIELHRSVEPGVTITPNAGLFARLYNSHSLPTADREFDAAFLNRLEPGAEDPAEALRQALDADTRRAMVAIKQRECKLAQDRAGFSAGFKRDSLYIALTTYRLKELAGPLRWEGPIDYIPVGLFFQSPERWPEAVRSMAVNLQTVHRVIDCLEQTEKEGSLTGS